MIGREGSRKTYAGRTGWMLRGLFEASGIFFSLARLVGCAGPRRKGLTAIAMTGFECTVKANKHVCILG